MLISSHLLGEVEQVSDNILMLEGGRVARSGSVTTLLGGETPMLVEVVSGALRLADALTAKGFAAVAKDDLLLTVPVGMAPNAPHPALSPEGERETVQDAVFSINGWSQHARMPSTVRAPYAGFSRAWLR